MATRKIGEIDMGKMKDLTISIAEMAEQIGDPYGFETETADYIATELQISVDEVQAFLDMMAQQYAEQAADLDAEYYGTV
jgi:hypothetical protein